LSREVLLLPPSDRNGAAASRGDGGLGQRGSGRRRQGGDALGLGRGQPWPRLALAGQAAGSSSASAKQCQDGTAGSGRLGDSKRTVGLGSD